MSRAVDAPSTAQRLPFSLSREAEQARDAQAKLSREAERDRLIADAEASAAYADLHMPDDLRRLAELWKLSHLMEQVWQSGFQTGFRKGIARATPAAPSSQAPFGPEPEEWR